MDLSQVTLTQMRYAVAVARAENFRLAAELCHVSQSGLSMQIQKLEESLDLVLFDRGKKPVKETHAGSIALTQMRSILRETERLGQLAAEEDEPAGPYRLGVIPTLSSTVLPLFLGTFVREYPRVDLVVEEMKTADIIANLHSDTLDAGIAATPLHVPGLHETPLAHESLLAYLPPGDPLLRKKSVTQAQLEKRDLWIMPEGHCFRSQVLSYCRGTPKSLGPLRFESGSFETLIQLVDDGLGATILPRLVADRLPQRKQTAQLRTLTGPAPVREIALVRARQDLRRGVSEALLATVKTKLEERLSPASRRSLILEPT